MAFDGAGSNTASYAGSSAVTTPPRTEEIDGTTHNITGVIVDLSQAAETTGPNAGYIVLGTKAGGHAVGDKLKDIDNLIGSSFKDLLTGNNEVNHLNGGGNDDILRGGGGGDTLIGGSGKDILFGEAGNDIINGGSGNDSLFGGAGNDNLSGGSGADIYTGGAGADNFILSLENDHRAKDIAKDFTDGEDKIGIHTTKTVKKISDYDDLQALLDAAMLKLATGDADDDDTKNDVNILYTGGTSDETVMVLEDFLDGNALSDLTLADFILI